MNSIVRNVRQLVRPSKAANLQCLEERGETVASLRIREATAEDAAAIAQLHVVTFKQTHGGPFGRGPTYETRERQWREAFANADGSWFCLVIEKPDHSLIGFAKGIPHAGDSLGFAGELNKIYILREYQRVGLGRRLLGHVARRFLTQNISSMLLFGEATNPSNEFYEVMGAEKLLSAAGEFHGAYGWRNLRTLADACPIE